MRIGRISICLVNVVRRNLEPMTRCACLSRELFTQIDPWTRPAGSTAETGFVYTGNNPMAYVDLSGMCRSSTLRRMNPIVRMESTPPTTVAGSKTDCSSLFADMLRIVQAIKAPGQGTKGLETRWFEMMRGSPSFAESFVHGPRPSEFCRVRV